MNGIVKPKKRLFISLILVLSIAIVSIISVAVVFAATLQNTNTDINITYVIDSVGAKISASYATVSSGTAASKTAITNSDGTSEIEIAVSDDIDLTHVTYDKTVSTSLNSTINKVVYEYKFTNTAESSFTVGLTNTISGTNLAVAYKVSTTEIPTSKYSSAFEDTTLMPQALVNQGDTIYIYVSATLTGTSATFSSNSFVWKLTRAEDSSIRTLMLNNGASTGGQTSLKFIYGTNIAMPVVYSLPTPTDTSLEFAGYYTAANGTGTQYIKADGTSAHAADLANGATLYAYFAVGNPYIIENTAQGTAVTNIGDGGMYVATTSGTSFTYGAQTYTTGGEYLMLEPNQSVTLTSTTALAYADGVTVSMEKPSDLATKKFYAAYGAYPQTYVGATLNATLTSASLTATGKSYTTDINGTATTLTEYEYNGVKYAKLTSSKAYSTSYTFSTGETVANSTTYFFIVEPIVVKAMEVDANGAKVMTVNLLGSKRFDGDANDWETSELRTYLNGTFMSESGLSDVAQSISIKNEDYFGYAAKSGNTTDQIWLPSAEEIILWSGSGSEGFETFKSDKWLDDDNNSLRKLKPSDMAMATYSYYYKTNGAGYYFLRPAGGDTLYVCTVNSGGDVYTSNGYINTSGGFFPAFYVAFEDYAITQDTSSGTTVSTVKNYSNDNLYVEVASGTEFSYGSAKYTTSGEYLMLEAGQSIAITAQVSDSAILTEKPSDLATKKFYAAYGAYPQTYVGATLNATLTSASLTATGKSYTTDIDDTATTLTEYEYNGVKYAKLTSSKAYSTSYTFSTGETVASSTTYFFIVEPIVVKTMEVDTNGAKVMTVNLLGSKKFDGDASDWETSELRAYLNGTFLTESGLSDVAQAITIKNNVAGDYSSSTSDGSGTDTEDTIWLASYYEMSTKWGLDDTSRRRKPSDMALATYSYYVKIHDAGDYYLRSRGTFDDIVCGVDSYGYGEPHYGCSGTSFCFCPAFYINL